MKNLRYYIDLVEACSCATEASPPAALDEVAPPGKAAERWIKHRKAEFKKRYGSDYKRVLYAKAWKLFGK